MKHRLFKTMLLSLVASTALFSSCGDDDDTTNDYKNLSDPRIRSIRLNNIEQTFVVNDLEQLIYNYDSLNVGTNLSAVATRFYGYTSQPSVLVKQGNVWSQFKNGSTIDFTGPVEIQCTSEDGTQQKSYKIEIRIHTYDVSALTWHKYGTIDQKAKAVSQQTFTYNKKKIWFYADETGASHMMTSTDFLTWTESAIQLENANWSSAAIQGDSIYVQNTVGEMYVANMNVLEFKPYASAAKLDKILFTIGDKIWALGKEGESTVLYGKGAADFEKKLSLPSEFPTENLVSFTSSSGYTSLGYIYATQNGNGTVWSIDSKGNTRVLQAADGRLPYLKNPILFQYDNFLGIVGGETMDGTHSTKCYTSVDCGASWKYDWHKDLTGENATLSNPGTFVLSKEGEVIFVGGNTANGISNIVWKGVLNQLTADDLNYQN